MRHHGKSPHECYTNLVLCYETYVTLIADDDCFRRKLLARFLPRCNIRSTLHATGYKDGVVSVRWNDWNKKYIFISTSQWLNLYTSSLCISPQSNRLTRGVCILYMAVWQWVWQVAQHLVILSLLNLCNAYKRLNEQKCGCVSFFSSSYWF